MHLQPDSGDHAKGVTQTDPLLPLGRWSRVCERAAAGDRSGAGHGGVQQGAEWRREIDARDLKKTRTLVVNLEGDIWAALCVHLPVEVRNGVVGEYTMKGLSGVDVMIGELRQCWGDGGYLTNMMNVT